MLLLENENGTVRIELDEVYTVHSADNRHYDLILNPLSLSREDFAKALAIHVGSLSKEFHAAIVGPGDISASGCAILEQDILTVMVGPTVVQIRITDCTVLRQANLLICGSTYAIHRVKKGYVIHGETEIIMLDFSLAEKWRFAGEDVFVSVSGAPSFEITESGVHLRDFMDNAYVLDFDGNLIQ